MSEQSAVQHSDEFYRSDEISLFEVLHTLWTHKVLIILWTLLGIVLGVLVHFAIPQTYRLEIPFTVNYHSQMAEYMCNNTRNVQLCRQNIDFGNHPEFADLSIKSDKIVLRDEDKTVTRVEAQQMLVALKSMIGPHSKRIFEESTQSIVDIENLESTHSRNADITMSEILRLHHKIRQYENGTAFADIGKQEYLQARPALVLLVSIFGMLSLLVSAFFVLTRKAYLDWRATHIS